MHILVYSGHKIQVHVYSDAGPQHHKQVDIHVHVHTCIIIHVHVQIGVYIVSKGIVCEGISRDYKCVMLRSFCCCWKHSLELVV